MEGKWLRLRMDAVDAVFGHDAVVIPDVEANDRMIDTITRSNAGDDNLIPARPQVELFQRRFHGGFVEAVMGGFLHDILTGQRPQLLDEIRARAAEQQAVRPSEDGKFRVIFGADGLDVNDLPVHRAEAIEQAADIADDGFHAGPMALAPFHLHIDDNEPGRIWLQFDLRIGHRRILRNVGFARVFHGPSRIVNVSYACAQNNLIGRCLHRLRSSLPIRNIDLTIHTFRPQHP